MTRLATRPTGTLARVVRGAGALVVLLVAVGVIPWLLVRLAGNPLPSHPSVGDLWHVLSTPDDGSILIGLIALIAWVAWLVFTISVLTELIAVISRQRIRIRLPGLAGPQKLAGGLILLVLAIFIAPQQVAVAHTLPTGPEADRTTTVRATDHRTQSSAEHAHQRSTGTSRADDADGDHQRSDDDTVQHRVRDGDDLWSLAERYYGQGQQWRRIARANPTVLTGGPDRLEPGWTLQIPGAAGVSRQVRVRPGDSLSAIAERHYGNADRWRQIYAANTDRISNPDELPVGLRLTLPADTERSAVHDADRRTDHPDARTEEDTTQNEKPSPSQRTAGPADGSDPNGADQSDPAGADRSDPTGGERADTDEPAGDHPGAEAPPVGPAEERAPVGPGEERAPVEQSEPEALPVRGAEIAPHALQLTGVGAVLAAAVIGGLFTRRQLQLHHRGVGRRIPVPGRAARRARSELGRRGDGGLGVGHLDRALRAIGQRCRRTGDPVPHLLLAEVSDELIVLTMTTPDLAAPVGFTVQGTEWRLTSADAGYLSQDQDELPQERESPDCAQPYPALTSLGTAASGATVMINLEAVGLLALDGSGIGPRVRGALAAMATELALAPWADDLAITVVGGDHDLVSAIDRYNVGTADDLDHLLQRWEHRAGLQREHLSDAADDQPSAVDLRIDPDLADPWLPEVALIVDEPTVEQAERLRHLLLDGPPVTMAAVVLGEHPVDRTVHYVDLGADGIGGELSPDGRRFLAQLLDEPSAALVGELLDNTATEQTDPAPWWAEDFPVGVHAPQRARPETEDGPAGRQPSGDVGEISGDVSEVNGPALRDTTVPTGETSEHAAGQTSSARPAARDGERPSDRPGDQDHHLALVTEPPRTGPPPEVVDLERAEEPQWPSAAARHRSAGDVADPVAESDAHWAWLAPVDRRLAQPDLASEETVIVPSPFTDTTTAAPRHPTIMLLGPIELLGAAGPEPRRAQLQCVEYATWLLEHPNSTAQAMARGLVIAEGTRRSNMSRLRSWLGSDDRDEPYLPDAYSGRIVLSPLVSSDWHRLQLLTATGVNRAGTEALCRALDLVRGAPLADAAPGQWHWAEEMRTDMTSVIRDIGVELTGRALRDNDVDLARWAASRSLTAAPHDEFLTAARIRTEHHAGNPAEVERLALQLAAHGRALGIDLHPESVDLLQQVMEGRLRARA